VGLRSRLEKLEGAASASSRAISREALKALSDEELDALEDALEAALASPGGGGSFEDFYAATTERSRRALDAYTLAVEAVRRGEDPRPLLAKLGSLAGKPASGATDTGYGNYYRK
jgi:hypothetical protein